MGKTTGIEWAESTWNPTVGCTKISPGCDRCYAETFVNRFEGSKGFPLPFDEMLLRGEKFLRLPSTWKEPRRVFVNSLSDLFHQDIPDEFICRVFDVMLTERRHTFQVLTKRHGRMRSFVTKYLSGGFATQPLETSPLLFTVDNPPPNIWLGVSVEDQHWATVRIPALLETPAAVRWISAEPLLGPLDLGVWLYDLGSSMGPVLDWVVVGGESGAGARPMHPDWVRQVREDCNDAGVPWLFKQWGEWAPRDVTGPILSADRSACVSLDGTAHLGSDYPICYPNESDGAHMKRYGKKLAGRTLDGRTWDGYPA